MRKMGLGNRNQQNKLFSDMTSFLRSSLKTCNWSPANFAGIN